MTSTSGHALDAGSNQGQDTTDTHTIWLSPCSKETTAEGACHAHDVADDYAPPKRGMTNFMKLVPIVSGCHWSPETSTPARGSPTMLRVGSPPGRLRLILRVTHLDPPWEWCSGSPRNKLSNAR